MYISWWWLIQAHHALSNMVFQWLTCQSLYSLLHTNVILDYVNDRPSKNEESKSQWNEKQASIFHLWLGIWEREKGRHSERDRDQEFLFFRNELTEATSISSNVMLKWKLIVQYAATALGHASSISISGGVTKWVCSLGPTPRKADTSTNQPDFSIWHCCAAGILDECVLYVCMCVCVYMQDQRWGPIIQGMQMEWASWLMMKSPVKSDGWKREWRAAHSFIYPLQSCFIVSITLSFHIYCTFVFVPQNM